MRSIQDRRSWLCLLAVGALLSAQPLAALAGFHWKKSAGKSCAPTEGFGGEWHWMRSPDQEKRIVMSHYNRYCVRCHGSDGRGVWDMPDVPDFTVERWQATRSDAQIVRAIVEGRGACMPPFRGTLTLEETWAMARYLRTFVPGSEQPRPDRAAPESTTTAEQLPPPSKK